MSLLAEKFVIGSTSPGIEQHPAFIGNVSALIVEKRLRQFSIPYLYVLRTGETEGAYYVSYIDPNAHYNKVIHRPFVITITSEGWYFENGAFGGPFIDRSIDEVLCTIMHCDEGECIPYIED